MRDLNKAFEIEDGLIVGGVVIPDSIVEATRSFKPTYTGDLLTKAEYYNSLTQIDANRIAKCDFTYSADSISTQTNTMYESDGTTVFATESLTYTYTGDDITKVEVT